MKEEPSFTPGEMVELINGPFMKIIGMVRDVNNDTQMQTEMGVGSNSARSRPKPTRERRNFTIDGKIGKPGSSPGFFVAAIVERGSWRG